MIETSSGREVSKEKSEIRVSGSLEQHYSPKAQVLLDVRPLSGDGFIAISEIATPVGVIRLASPTSNEEFAHLLYQALRSGDNQNLQRIVVTQPFGDDIALAIRDRLLRASRGR
jgi:L-threonylcarbamoyladenylate synthase